MLVYENYDGGLIIDDSRKRYYFGSTIVLLAKACSHDRSRGICERHIGERSSRGFHKHTTLAIMPILASEALTT